MKKLFATGLLPCTACLLLAGPAPGRDVIYFDPVKKMEVKVRRVTIKEGPEGITITQPGKPEIKVSALDVREVDLDGGDIGGFDFIALRKPLAKTDRAAIPTTKEADRIKLWEESLPDFRELLPKLAPLAAAPPTVKRQVEFKFVQTLYRLAQFNEKHRDEAVKELEKFAKEHSGGWQISPSLMMLAQLQEDQGDLPAVLKTYETLAAVPGLSDEIRTTSAISAARTLMKTEKFAEAKVKLVALNDQLGKNPLAGKVKVYLAQCQILSDNPVEAQTAEKELRTMLAGSDDKTFKALAHNTLGDYYTKNKRDDDAFWEYLRVDTLYSEDRFEHARAMYHLIRLFREVKKDADRADSYFETLTKDRRFAGLEYQKKALKK